MPTSSRVGAKVDVENLDDDSGGVGVAVAHFVGGGAEEIEEETIDVAVDVVDRLDRGRPDVEVLKTVAADADTVDFSDRGRADVEALKTVFSVAVTVDCPDRGRVEDEALKSVVAVTVSVD